MHASENHRRQHRTVGMVLVYVRQSTAGQVQ